MINELDSKMQRLRCIRASVSLIFLNLTHTPNTLLGNIDKYIKTVLEDRAPYLLDEERDERNNMIKH